MKDKLVQMLAFVVYLLGAEAHDVVIGIVKLGVKVNFGPILVAIVIIGVVLQQIQITMENVVVIFIRVLVHVVMDLVVTHLVQHIL